MDFGAIIREARTSSGLSQADLAKRAGVSIGAIYELEVRGNGTVALLTRLCTALDLRFTGLPRVSGFPRQVRTPRQRRDWSQERLARKAGVSAPAIMRLERGQARIATLSSALKVLAPNARPRKPEFARWRGGARDCRFTPREMLHRINSVIGPIYLDPCAHPASAVIAHQKLFEEDDGLSHEWIAATAYANPPYSRSAAFLRKAVESWTSGNCSTVLLLLPVSTQTEAFHRYVVGSADVFFLRGRIAFESLEGRKDVAPFSNMVVLYGADRAMIDRMLANFDCVHLPRAAAVGRKTTSDAVQMRIAAE